jgi:tol-pal system-associated acyl-CoA thioesterase
MKSFIFPMKAYIEDTDFGGVVYHSNYLKFFERARSEWLDVLGMSIAWQLEQQVYFAIRSVNIDFLKPARLTDQLEVVSQMLSYTATSIIFSQQLRKTLTTDTILCNAEVKVVCLDQTFRPRPLPRQLHDFFTGDLA